MVKNLPSSVGGMGLIPGREVNIPHASWPKKTEHNRRNVVTNSINTKNGPH